MDSTHLRLLFPQWQGAGTSSIRTEAAEFRPDLAHRGYATGSRVLEAVLPAHDGPTATVPVSTDDVGRETDGGIESRRVVLSQLEAALSLIAENAPERISTLGGECSVSVGPFASLAARYGEDLAVVWIDSHPDADTPDTGYDGFHAMALALLTGHGDREILDRLPATVPASRAALVGLHAGEDDALAHLPEWGLTSFSPDRLRDSTDPLTDWLRSTGCTKVAVHLDVDVVDSDEAVLGLGAEPGGLRIAEVRRIVDDLSRGADVVGMSVAEFLPRQVLRVMQLLEDLPLLGPTARG
jgi:arginase